NVLKEQYSPEFLNRFDEIVYFNQLSRANIEEIVEILFKEMTIRLEDLELNVVLNNEAKIFLASEGYDPVYGARYLRNVMEKKLLDPLSEMILRENIEEGNTIDISLKKNNLDFRIIKSRKKNKVITT
ncbi:ATP-dependent Clp protease ATP-binding subunit, partial [candidate division WOR-3 bacterium]|nr:ATP-dependent Clp protease ATP-binding subunit [candidate division WOR-3 bacterium]